MKWEKYLRIGVSNVHFSQLIFKKKYMHILGKYYIELVPMTFLYFRNTLDDWNWQIRKNSLLRQ